MKQEFPLLRIWSKTLDFHPFKFPMRDKMQKDKDVREWIEPNLIRFYFTCYYMLPWTLKMFRIYNVYCNARPVKYFLNVWREKVRSTQQQSSNLTIGERWKDFKLLLKFSFSLSHDASSFVHFLFKWKKSIIGNLNNHYVEVHRFQNPLFNVTV